MARFRRAPLGRAHSVSHRGYCVRDRELVPARFHSHFYAYAHQCLFELQAYLPQPAEECVVEERCQRLPPPAILGLRLFLVLDVFTAARPAGVTFLRDYPCYLGWVYFSSVIILTIIGVFRFYLP